jgi:hypothetical protein
MNTPALHIKSCGICPRASVRFAAQRTNIIHKDIHDDDLFDPADP